MLNFLRLFLVVYSFNNFLHSVETCEEPLGNPKDFFHIMDTGTLLTSRVYEIKNKVFHEFTMYEHEPNDDDYTRRKEFFRFEYIIDKEIRDSPWLRGELNVYIIRLDCLPLMDNSDRG